MGRVFETPTGPPMSVIQRPQFNSIQRLSFSSGKMGAASKGVQSHGAIPSTTPETTRLPSRARILFRNASHGLMRWTRRLVTDLDFAFRALPDRGEHHPSRQHPLEPFAGTRIGAVVARTISSAYLGVILFNRGSFLDFVKADVAKWERCPDIVVSVYRVERLIFVQFLVALAPHHLSPIPAAAFRRQGGSRGCSRVRSSVPTGQLIEIANRQSRIQPCARTAAPSAEATSCRRASSHTLSSVSPILSPQCTFHHQHR